MKKSCAAAIAILLIFSFSGCSYRALDDALQRQDESAVQTIFEPSSKVALVDKKVGDSFDYITPNPASGTMEISLLKMQAFRNMEEAGIRAEECITENIVMENPDRFVFLLLDMKIHNIDADPEKDDFYDLPFLISDFIPITELHEENPELGKDYAYVAYFSEHPPITSTSTNYYHYVLQMGETLECRVGVIAPKVDFENDNLWLSIGGGTGDFFELFPSEADTNSEIPTE